MRRVQLVLLTLVVLCTFGCLQQTPPPKPTNLSGVISEALTQERKDLSSLASQMGQSPLEPQTLRDLWKSSEPGITDKCADTISKALKSELDVAADDRQKTQAIWREVARGYAP